MYQERVELYKELEKEYNSKILVYITSDRNNMEAQIAVDMDSQDLCDVEGRGL